MARVEVDRSEPLAEKVGCNFHLEFFDEDCYWCKIANIANKRKKKSDKKSDESKS